MKRYLLILLSFACISLAAQDRKSTKSINDEVLFAPEFHAYSHGRINNEQGEGRKWYNRFKVMHISDIHSSYSQLREALEVSEGKVSAVLNTGDDAHGNDMEDATAKDLHVLTMMHYSFGDAEIFNEETANPDAHFFQDPFMIPDIIDAVQNKTILTRTYPDESGLTDVVIDRDFSNVADLDFVAHLFGHIHSKNAYRCQKTDGKKYDILMLGESAIGTPGTALNKILIEKGTVNDISFSALEIDVVEKAVYRVSYGAYLNYDRSNSSRTERIPYRF